MQSLQHVSTKFQVKLFWLKKDFFASFLMLIDLTWKLRFSLLKWNPFDKHFIAAACMHNGFAIVKVDESNVETIVEYKKHGSLAYGIDWFKAPSWGLGSKEGHGGKVNGLINNSTSLNEPLLASCSFYDRSLHIWRPNLYQ